MDMNYMSENIKLFNLSGAVKKRCTLEYEHVISDSKADVEEVIKTDAYVTEDNVAVDEGTLTLTGKMNIMICIKSVDLNIFGVQQMIDIEEELDQFESDGEPVIVSKCVMEEIECQVLNERKVAVKVSYSIYVDCSFEKEISVINGMDEEEEHEAEILTDEVNMHKYVENIEKTIETSDTYLVPNDCPEIFELLSYEAVIKNMECNIVEAGVSFSGNVCFRIYYSFGDAGENIFYLENCVSFNETEENPDNAYDRVFPNVKVSNFTLDVEQDSDGEYRLVNGNAKISVNALCFTEENVNAAKDIYGINNKITPEFKSEPYSYPVKDNSNTCQISETLTLGAEEQVTEVIGMDAHAYITEQDYEEGEILSVNGIVPISIIYKDVNGNINVFNKDMPLRYDEKIEAEQGMQVKVLPQQVNAGYNLLSGNEVDIRININLSFVIYASDTFAYIGDITEEEYGDDTVAASLILHYCTGEESVWDISKKYHIRQNTLRQVNKLEDGDTLEDGSQVIIPL